MGIITETCKQSIRERVQLQDLVREYNVHLIPSGRRMKGLCPFHTEKTPSFTVNVENQNFYCFGCQAGGDIFKFVMSMNHMDFPEAIEMLARRAGVAVEYEGGSAMRSRAGKESTAELYEVLSLAQGYFHHYLLEDPQARPAREYLKRRGIETSQWEKFRLGFSPPQWDAFTRFAARKGVLPQVLERAGLARPRGDRETGTSGSPSSTSASGYYDYFRGRVMFPIQDPQGRPIGFGARTMGDDQPKYLNTPKTAVFDKSQVLYALGQARMGIQRESRIAIVEGYTDAIMAHQAGLDFFVASLGTAFTQENAKRLSRLAPRVFLVFDGDDAGQRASERSLDLLVPESIDVRIYSVKDGKDPCDAILALGGGEFRRRMETDAVGIFEFKWRRTMEGRSVADSGAALRAKALDEFLTLLARVPNVVARKLHLREFSERLGISEEDITLRMKEVGQKSSSSRRSAASPNGAQPWRRAPAAPLQGLIPAGGGGITTQDALTTDLAVADKRAHNNRSSAAAPSVAELILECILALPAQAGNFLGRLPENFFDMHPFLELSRSIQRQLEGGAISVPRLTQEVEDPEAQRLLSQILSRIEDDDGRPTQDYEEVWLRVERDLVRQMRRSRAEGLKALMVEESARGNQAACDAYRREYFEILKESKK